MNQLNHSDVIKRNRFYTDNQTRLFLELLKDFLDLSDSDISPDQKKSLKLKINDKINDSLNNGLHKRI